MSDSHSFDVVVLGTSLTQSILAAALSKAGFKVAHVDVEKYYGAEEASLSLDELIQWTTGSSSSRYTHITRDGHTSLSHSRYYSLSLCPSVIPSVGPIISSLISSGVSKYGGFKLVDSVGIYSHPGTVKSVPSSKEDIFKNKQLTLIDKRRIMRFLTFAMSEFEDKPELKQQRQADLPFFEFVKTVFGLGEDVVEAIGYALAYCTSPTEPTIPALTRLRKYMRAAGRYGPSPFLVGHYGGTGEIAQGFCRAAAVSGAIYILGRRILSISSCAPPAPEPNNSTWSKVDVEDVPDPLFCKLVIASPNMMGYLPPEWHPTWVATGTEGGEGALSIARCVAIIDFPITFSPRDSSVVEEGNSEDQHREPGRDDQAPSPSLVPPSIDTGILVFPPSSLPGGSTSRAATVLVTGESAMSAPRGKSVLYIALAMELGTEERNPKEVLKPYLDATLSLSLASEDRREPLLATYYFEHPHSRDPRPPPPTTATTTPSQVKCLVTPPLPNDRLPEAPDLAAIHAERVFREAVWAMRPQEPVENWTFWPSETGLSEMDDDDADEW